MATLSDTPDSVPTLATNLHELCLDLHRNPFPEIPNPPKCPKRASVALILRIRPRYPDAPEPPASFPSLPVDAQLASFFRHDWVQRGDPEILFIKRAARRGDRFTSHVAFPGGKRDPTDASDRAAAERETREEVGLDLTAGAIAVGNLAQRVLMSEWGTVPLMVLCPFVYLLTAPSYPALRPQPTEVHGAHWVPLRALLEPSLRTWERTDVADRLPRIGGTPKKLAFRLLLGQMMYGATFLVPSFSVLASEGLGFMPEAPPSPTALTGRLSKVMGRLLGADHAGNPDPQRPLRLWGLTYGMVADFLDVLPNVDSKGTWAWPTFSAPDVRLVTWLVTLRFRRERIRTMTPDHKSGTSSHPRQNRTATGTSQPKTLGIVDEGCDTVDLASSTVEVQPGEGQTPVQRAIQAENGRDSTMWALLTGYFGLMRRAVYVAMALRAGALGALGVVLVRRWMARRRVTA